MFLLIQRVRRGGGKLKSFDGGMLLKPELDRLNIIIFCTLQYKSRPELNTISSRDKKMFTFNTHLQVKLNIEQNTIFQNCFIIIIESQKLMVKRSIFFQLLVTLACFDSTYLFGSILESFRKEFGMASNIHIILFPYLLYPFNQVNLMALIVITVNIINYSLY